MNLSKTSYLIAIALGSTLPLSANEYKFEELGKKLEKIKKDKKVNFLKFIIT